MKPKHTGVWLSVPAIFDPSLIPSLKGLENESRWLLHKIISLFAAYKHDQKFWVNISRQTMEQFIQPSQVTLVKNSLINAGVIACDGKFKKGSHSQGYKLTKPYRTGITRVECTKRALAAKILAHRIRVNSQPTPEDKLDAINQHLLAWLRRTAIDTDKAYGIIDSLPERTRSQRKRRKRHQGTGRRKTRKVIAGYAKHLNRHTVDQINHHELDFSVCRYGRVHTPITRLLTDVRSCLSIDGQPLVNIDIRNSQMIFFSLLLIESRLSSISSSDDSGSFHSVKAGTASHENIVLRAVKDRGSDLGVLGMLLDDERLFVERTLEGTLYDELLRDYELTITSERSTGTSGTVTSTMEPVMRRKQFKRQLFQDVFYGNHLMTYASQSPLTRLFQRVYPNVYQFIVRQKSGHTMDSFKQLSRRMQQRESQYMIGTVCDRLRKHHRDIPVLTIHDSIMTTPDHVQTVKRIMLEEFSRLGVAPTLHIEGM